VHAEYGIVNGEMVPSVRKYEGVNQHNKLATTPEEQAKREAERDWVKQLRKGYAPECTEGKEIYKRVMEKKLSQGNRNVGVAETIRGAPSPKEKKTKTLPTKNYKLAGYASPHKSILCTEWSEEQKVLKYFDFAKGVYVQPKLDGVRCHAQIQDREVVLTSRNGNQIGFFAEIRKELKRFLEGNEDVILDGELYTDTLMAEPKKVGQKMVYFPSDEIIPRGERIFQILTAASNVSALEAYPIEDQIQYHAFDIVDPTKKLTQVERFDRLDRLFKGSKQTRIKFVRPSIVHNVIEINDALNQYTADGYEGIVVRAHDLLYECGARSLKLRKLKKFKDEEYVIIGVHVDEGVSEEHFSWVCRISDDKTFRVKPRGTRKEKMLWYKNSASYFGTQLKVKYQEKTPDNIPRFPVGIGFRYKE
jgi:hypothetical protein